MPRSIDAYEYFRVDKEFGNTPLIRASFNVATISANSRAEVVKPQLAAPGIKVFKKNDEGKSALDVAYEVASLLEEVVDVKQTYGALLLALMRHGVSRAVASDVAMHGLPSEHAKAMAKHMRDTWPASPLVLRGAGLGSSNSPSMSRVCLRPPQRTAEVQVTSLSMATHLFMILTSYS